MSKRTQQSEAGVTTVGAAPEVVIAQPRIGELLWICVAGWLIPGAGHFILGKRARALIVGVSILLMFLLGLAMKGEFYTLQSGAILQSLGFLGEMCVGAAMPIAKFFGYPGGDPFYVSSDYGTAFLVSAGMLNLLAILDAYDIAMGRKT